MRRLCESEFEIGDKVLYDNSVPCEITGTVSDGTYDIEPIDHDQDWNYMRSVSADKLMRMAESQLSESWEDEYEDFSDYDEMVQSTIQYELDYDPIPNESTVEDFIESISDLSFESIEPTHSENEVYDVEYDEDNDPVTASISFDIQFAIHMSSSDDAKALLDILEEESTVTAEDYLSRNYYIDYLDVQSMSCSISDTTVYLNIDGNVDINAIELVGSLA